MSARHNENPEPISKGEQIRQAANTLGISERTVYRRLRSGKLEQLPTEIPVSVNVMTNVSKESVEAMIASQVNSQIDRVVCQVDMTDGKLSAMRQELASRDAQIQSLLENQKELTLTIQKLQAQIFELARLALLQSAKMEEKPAEVPVVVEPPAVKRRGGLLGFLRTLGWHREDR